MVEEGKHYFLSRPRRFGKSLFLDTLNELFAGNEPLFEGLAIHEHWDWSVRRPVVRLDFGSGHFGDPDSLHQDMMAQLDAIEREAGITPRYDAAPLRFRHLLRTLHESTGRRVAVLVDEYDKPILDALDTPAVARANRDSLHGLYSTVKSSDAHIKFTLLTGVSKFSKVSLFSGLNNLKDITLDPRYSAVCGYTDADLDAVFAPELPGLDRDEIRDWYNGYGWLGEERGYNPFDILLLFDRRQFEAWWFETGTPSFLVEMLARRRIGSAKLDNMLSQSDLLSTFDVGDIATEALLFQTGYLTIRGTEPRGGKMYYRLGYPNREVRQSLNESLLQPPDGGTSQPAGAQRPSVRPAAGQRFRGPGDAVPGALRQHPVRVAHEERDRPLRGLLRQRVLLLLRRARARRHRGGQQQPRPPRHGDSLQRQRLPVRIQGGRGPSRGAAG